MNPLRRALIFALALALVSPVFAQDTGSVERERGKNTPGSRDRPGPTRDDPLFIGRKILFLIDASGSMAIGGRFDAARAKAVELIQGLDEEQEVGIALFHERLEKLFGASYLRASAGFKRRVSASLKKARVRLDRSTDFERCLHAAVKRQADIIVLISDGVITAGEDEPRDLFKLFDAAIKNNTRRPPKLHAYAIQSGTYGPKPAIEDKPAAADLLESLAARRGGQFRGLSGPPAADPVYRPPGLAALPDPVIEPRYYKSRDPIEASVLGVDGFFPAFHVRVTDPALLRGELAIAEYRTDLSLVVEYFDAALGRQRRKLIPVHHRGARLSSVRYLKAVGPLDNQEQHGSHLDKRIYLHVNKGGSIKIVYTRAGQSFTKTILVNPR